jgi:hypothetical protein
MIRTILVVFAVGLLALPAISQAQFKAGDWDLTLSGTGASDHNLGNNSFGATVGLGYLMTKEVEVGLRQTVGWASTDKASGGTGNDYWNGTTRAFADYHFDFDRLQPYVGGSIGYAYGRDSAGSSLDSVVGGVEAGVKYFLNSTTYVQFNVGYDIPVSDGGWDDGSFLYSLGLGVKL